MFLLQCARFIINPQHDINQQYQSAIKCISAVLFDILLHTQLASALLFHAF